MIRSLIFLFSYRVFSVKFLFHAWKGRKIHGWNILAWLYACHKIHPENIAIIENGVKISFEKLYFDCLKTHSLIEKYNLYDKSVAILFANSYQQILLSCVFIGQVKETIFLNPEMGNETILNLISQHKISLIFCDSETKNRFKSDSFVLLDTSKLISSFMKRSSKKGKIVFLSSGTTGLPKKTSRTIRFYQYLQPFYSLLHWTKIHQLSSVFITIPLSHGFGFSSFICALVLRKTIIISSSNKTENIITTIQQSNPSVLLTVPTLLHRILEFNSDSLQTVDCIITGSSQLIENPKLKSIREKHYHLYGTTEVGFSFLATPSDLSENLFNLGKPVFGLKYKVSETGELLIRNNWSQLETKNDWNATGDLVRFDKNKNLIYQRRLDQNVNIGGHLVNLDKIKSTLLLHNSIQSVRLEISEASDLGTKILAEISCLKDSNLSEESLKIWIKKHLSKAETPREILLKENENKLIS